MKQRFIFWSSAIMVVFVSKIALTRYTDIQMIKAVSESFQTTIGALNVGGPNDRQVDYPLSPPIWLTLHWQRYKRWYMPAMAVLAVLFAIFLLTLLP